MSALQRISPAGCTPLSHLSIFNPLEMSSPPIAPDGDDDQTTLRSFVGLLIGTFAHGALLTLSLLCFVQLNLKPRGSNSYVICTPRQKRVFQIYIILLSIASTIFEVKNARTLGIILLSQRPDSTSAGHLLVTPMDVVVSFVAILTDGLLVSHFGSD